ncbi:hypothetical protein J4E93_009166 [Alternaria ventricosa]|uniref:uncharacterized protein n=1 Tax=Alternaria ventricosa TaxID=1187951 RepID=UPI0020C4C31F|nr:uncharacterized protein J4E93_009166 [Alternaria ventricosa]KAI4639812.1 hypothetical protein J4E93_009166 [Alternaria ventricosa]
MTMKVRTIRRVPVHDAQMVKLRLLVSIRQARIPQAQEATSAPCTEGDVHDSANAVADLSSAILGLQVSKAWAPSTEHNEEAQNKRNYPFNSPLQALANSTPGMAYPMDLSRNENELDDDKFTPYVEGTKIHEHVLDDGTFMYIDSKTGKQVKDQHGTPLDLPKQATGAGDETVADGGDEEGEKDGNGDDTRDVDNEDAPSGSETAGTMGPVLNAKPPATNAKKPEFLTMGFCIDCSGVTPTDELFTHYRADISKDVVQCMDCQKAEDERTNTAICRKCLYRWYPQYFVDPSRPGHCNLCTGHMLL